MIVSNLALRIGYCLITFLFYRIQKVPTAEGWFLKIEGQSEEFFIQVDGTPALPSLIWIPI